MTTDTTQNNNVIPLDGITNQNPLKVVTPPAEDINGLLGIANGNYNYVSTLTQNANDAANAKNTTQNSILDTMNSLLNKTADTQAANDSSGLTDATKQLNDLNAQAKSLNREALAIPIQTQQRNANTGATDAGVAPQTAGALRENALKALSLAQQADIATANYDAAKNKAQQIIDLKYQPLEQKLEILKTQLEMNKDAFDAADKKRAEATAMAIKKQESDLADSKSIAFELAKKGITDQALYDKINSAKTIQDKLQVAAPYLKEVNTEVVKMGDGAVLIDKQTGKVLKSYGSVPGASDTTTSGSNKNNPYNGVVTTILGSGKFTKDQALAVKNAINNGEDQFTVVKNQAKNIMGQTEATKVTNFEVAQSSMNDLNNSLKQFYAAGGKTSYLSGNFEKVINNLGNVNDPKLVDLATQIQAQLQIYRNAVSGTAYSVQEGKDIASVFPGINKSEGLNTAIMAGRMKAFDSVIDGSYRTALGKSYDTLKSLNQSGAKGNMDDKSFIDKSLKSQNVSYADVVNNTPTGQIPVIDNKTGQTGYIPIVEFVSSLYTKL